MVEGSGLENRHTRKGIVGSNPTLSASFIKPPEIHAGELTSPLLRHGFSGDFFCRDMRVHRLFAGISWSLLLTFAWVALRTKIGPDEAESEGCGGPTVKDDNEARRVAHELSRKVVCSTL